MTNTDPADDPTAPGDEGDGVAAGMGGISDAVSTEPGPGADRSTGSAGPLAPVSSPPGPARSAPATDPAPTEGASSDDGGRDQAALALGVVRLGVGAALMVAPRWAGRIWVGPGADGPGSLVFARAVGARDVALGVRIISGALNGEPVRKWVEAGFLSDGADVVATMLAGRHLTPGRRAAMPLIAAAVGAAGVASSRPR